MVWAAQVWVRTIFRQRQWNEVRQQSAPQGRVMTAQHPSAPLRAGYAAGGVLGKICYGGEPLGGGTNSLPLPRLLYLVPHPSDNKSLPRQFAAFRR